MVSNIKNTKRDIVKIPVERNIANELRRRVQIGETYSMVIEKLLKK